MPHDTWARACAVFGIPSDVATKWFNTLQKSYSPSGSRFYHNWNMLTFKVNLVGTVDPFPSRLIFAVFFQYFEYDVRQDSSEMNSGAFKRFYVEAGIDNVSRTLISESVTFEYL